MSIGQNAFANCASLTTVIIERPSSLGITTLGTVAFNSCQSLTVIFVPDSDSLTAYSSATNWSNYAGLLKIFGAFVPSAGLQYIYTASTDSYAVSLQGVFDKTIYIPAMHNGKYVTEIAVNNFDWSINDTTKYVIFENGSTLTTIGDFAFTNYASLRYIRLPDSVISIGDLAFAMCENLTQIWLPNNVEHLGMGVFAACAELTYIKLPSGITEIPDMVFYLCTSLNSVYIPNGVTHISYGAFAGCFSLSSIVLPDSITDIGELVFSNCYSLGNINIPYGVTYIGVNAFYYCTSLLSIAIPDSVIFVEYGAFSYSDITIYTEWAIVPSGWDSDWDTTVWWSSLQKRPVIWGATLSMDGSYVESITKTSTTIQNPNNVTISTPYRAGYEFDGWDDGVTVYNCISEVPNNTTVYAIWVEAYNSQMNTTSSQSIMKSMSLINTHNIMNHLDLMNMYPTLAAFIDMWQAATTF